jgi:hypothetical protein
MGLKSNPPGRTGTAAWHSPMTVYFHVEFVPKDFSHVDKWPKRRRLYSFHDEPNPYYDRYQRYFCTKRSPLHSPLFNLHCVTRQPFTMMRLTALALIVSATSAFEVPSLTPDNYDSLTEGKTVFLKFFAPWVRRYKVNAACIRKNDRCFRKNCE